MSDIPLEAHKEMEKHVLAARDEGKILVLGLEGPMTMPLEEFVKQPADGILYDLNRGEEVALTFMADRKWVNDFAVALTIRKLVQQRDEARAARAEGFALDAAIKIMRDSLQEFGYQDRALSEGLDLSGEIERRIRSGMNERK